MTKEILLDDHDDLVIVVRVAPSVFDPGGERAALANVYRVVAFGDTLELVSLGGTRGLTPREVEDVTRRNVI